MFQEECGNGNATVWLLYCLLAPEKLIPQVCRGSRKPLLGAVFCLWDFLKPLSNSDSDLAR